MSTHFVVMIIFYLLEKKCQIGELEYGDLITFNKYINEFNDSLNFLIKTITTTLYGLLEWRKFLEIFDIEPKIFSKKDAIIPKEYINENGKEKENINENNQKVLPLNLKMLIFVIQPKVMFKYLKIYL